MSEKLKVSRLKLDAKRRHIKMHTSVEHRERSAEARKSKFYTLWQHNTNLFENTGRITLKTCVKLNQNNHVQQRDFR